MRVSGKFQEWAFTEPLECKSDEHILIHSFLYIPECSLLLLGRDSLHKLGTTIHLIGDKLEMDISLDKVHKVIILMCVCLCSVVSNVFNPTDYNTGSCAHGIFQGSTKHNSFSWNGMLGWRGWYEDWDIYIYLKISLQADHGLVFQPPLTFCHNFRKILKIPAFM